MIKSRNPQFKRWLQPQWAALLSLALMAPSANTHADTATIYGSLGNFDVVNNTGQSAHGFEIELEGLQPADVVYSFSAQRYGASRIVPTATGVIVRWESPWGDVLNFVYPDFRQETAAFVWRHYEYEAHS
jgi:hypothetical protein